MPRLDAIARASARVPSDEYGEGMDTHTTRSAPRASTATMATSAESIPPDSAITTRSKPFLCT